MNGKYYIFGKFPLSISLYPNDYCKDVIKHVLSYQQDNEHQLFTYREGNLIYYIYVRKIDNGINKVGICAVFNDIYFKSVNNLIRAFTYAFDELILSGATFSYTQICLNDSLKTCTKSSNTSISADLLRAVFRKLDYYLSIESDATAKLPTIDFSSQNMNKLHEFDIIGKSDNIGGQIIRHPLSAIIIPPVKDSPIMSNHKSQLSQLHQSLLKKTAECNDLRKKHNKLFATKKNLTKMIWLIGVVAILAIGGLSLLLNLNEANARIDNLQVNIDSIGTENQNLGRNLTQTSSELQNTTAKLTETEAGLSQASNENRETKHENEKLTAQNKQLIAEKQKLLNDKARMQSEINELKETVAWLEKKYKAKFNIKHN